MSSDLPDYALLYPLGAEPRFTGFPHRLVLRPEGVSVVAGPVSAAFLIDPDCGLDVLNGAALAHYLEQRAHNVCLPDDLKRQVQQALQAVPERPWDLVTAEIATDIIAVVDWDAWAASVASDLDEALSVLQ